MADCVLIWIVTIGVFTGPTFSFLANLYCLCGRAVWDGDIWEGDIRADAFEDAIFLAGGNLESIVSKVGLESPLLKYFLEPILGGQHLRFREYSQKEQIHSTQGGATLWHSAVI
jgi:hypothetical protein